MSLLIGACPVTTDCIVAMSWAVSNEEKKRYDSPHLSMTKYHDS